MKAQHLFTYDNRTGHLFRIPDCPDNVTLDLTWRCNYRCSFCYNTDDSRRRGDPPWEATDRLLRELASWGVREILYLGGEPLLHSKFDNVMELGSDLGFRQRVVTNGSTVTKPRARLLARHSVEVGVSLHSAERSVHNWITRSPEGFSETLAGLECLLSARAKTFVQYSPTRHDPDGLSRLTAFLADRYAGAICFIDVNRLLPFGEAANDPERVIPQSDECWSVLRQIGRSVASGWSIRAESYPHCWVRARARSDGLDDQATGAILSTLRPCYMGINQLAFDPLGRVKLCPAGPPLAGPMGIGELADYWVNSALLCRRRADVSAPCCLAEDAGIRLCRWFYSCLGGCRSAAISPNAGDPLRIGPDTEACDK